MKLWLGMVLSLTGFSAQAGSWNGRVVEIHATGSTEVTQKQLVERLVQSDLIVLGEKHNTTAVQQMQAFLVANTQQASLGSDKPFTLGWEFLNFKDQETIETEFARFASGKISGFEFLHRTQGENSSVSYVPILQAVAELGGQLLGLNLSRAQKAPVVKGGIAAADPSLVPAGFEMGGQNYRKRFAEAMGGHADPRTLENYFAAQCLTDDVMAYHLVESAAHQRRFLVAGSFHTDYQDGTVARIRARAPGLRMVTVRIFDASDWSERDLRDGLVELLVDPEYGPIADYLVFVNEPRR